MKWYAVRQGRNPGIYTDWPSCESQVKGFSRAEYKSFSSRADAEAYLNNIQPSAVQPNLSAPVIYADGSCQNGKAGYAFFYPEDSHGWVVYGPVVPATNNRGELMAVIRALQTIPIRPIIIRTDSLYLIDTVTKWLPNWIQRYGLDPNRWRTATGNVPANTDLLVVLYNLSQSNVIYEHIYGHTGVYGNEVADNYAKQGCFASEERTVLI